MKEKTDRLKRFSAAFVILPLLALLALNTAAAVRPASDEDLAALYKAKCAMCHGGKAERFFEPAKSDAVHIEAIMKGVKPKMPGYETKGINAEQTKALVDYMRSLRLQQ